MTSNGRDKFAPVVGGDKGAEYEGWQESLPELTARLQRNIRGLKERLAVPTKDTSIWPSAIGGERVFHPEDAVVEVDTAQGGLATNPCNFIVRSGKNYPISIIFPGPGVFVGRWLKFSLYMRFNNPGAGGIQEVPIVTNTQGFFGGVRWTTRFCVFPRQPASSSVFGGGVFGIAGNSPALNYCWNISVPRTGRKYSDFMISHVHALPRTWMPTGLSPPGDALERFVALPDGDLFDFEDEFVFERDGQCTVDFFPITDFLQFDSSLDSNNVAPVGLLFDDRENGKRDQSVRVQVEMHGERYETMQDAIHAGALTQKW